MAVLPPDPLSGRGLLGFADDFKAGRITCEEVTAAYLARIDSLNDRLGAYQFVAHDAALATARAIDALFAAGTYLGPLMGAPVAIKDVFAIETLPKPRAGSKISLPAFADSGEGRFIQALRRAGCVFLGQTRAVEFCLGIVGTSAPLGTPWNPYDLHDHRAPGGSSSGSGVAAGAGLCAFAVGTDTGGSVRVPAAFNGVFGFKTTAGIWPTDGVFPLDPRLDTIGLLTRTAADASVAYSGISSCLNGLDEAVFVKPARIDRLRLGVPDSYFNDGLCPEVAAALHGARAKLSEAGVRFDGIDFPEVRERETYFPFALPATLLATLGLDEFQRQKHLMDPIIAARIESAIGRKAFDYIALERKRQINIARARRRLVDFDAVVSATATVLPPRLSELDDPNAAMALALGMTRNTQPANYFEWCAASLPIPQTPGDLPIGFQLMMKGSDDARLLGIAMAVENVLGRQEPPLLTQKAS
ncbi:MAG: amidase [Caldimonas sp.]